MRFKSLNLKHNEIFLLGILYTLMHGGILLIPNAIFWDDWVFYRAESSVIFDTFAQAGAMFNLTGYLHVYMLKIGPWFYKLMTFFLMFWSGVLFNAILKKTAILSSENRFLVTLFFLILPFNTARVALIDFPYTLGIFLFIYAWYLIDRNRFVALGLFFISFNVNSLLVFYALPMLDLMYRQGYLKNHKTFFSFVGKYPDFLILPFLFYFVKVYFYSPTGLYANYNQHYSLDNIQYAVKAQLKDAVNFRFNPYLFLALIPVTFACAKKWRFQNPLAHEIKVLPLFLLGCLALFLAGLPYWILGLIPTFNEWSSRHQLLFPLGSALVIVAILQLFQRRIKTIVAAILVAASLSYGLTTYYGFIQDWKKQSQLLSFMTKNATKINTADLVIFDDQTKSFNAIGREYRFYEWNGLLEQATGNQKHFGIQPNELSQYRRGGFDQYFQVHYKAGSHARTNSTTPVLITINIKESRSLLHFLFKEFEFNATPVKVTATKP